MKLLTLFSLAILAVACAPGNTTETKSDSTAVATDSTPTDTAQVFVNWMEVGVRDSPGEKGKYLTTVYLAENIELLGDTASEISGKNRVHYNKIKLADGKECWIRTDFIAIGYQPAVVEYSGGNIFSRPDRVAVTGKTFDAYDVVAVRWVKHGWLEAKGKARGENWFTNGYLSTNDVRIDGDEVKLAALIKRAAAAKDPKMKAALEAQFEQFGETQLYQSLFIHPGMADNNDGVEEEEEDVTVSSAYLVGDWTREWNDADNNPVSEVITITDDLRYVADGGKLVMGLTEMAFHTDLNKIVFTKANDNTRIKAILSAVSGSKMQGTEEDGDGGSLEVTYTRVGN